MAPADTTPRPRQTRALPDDSRSGRGRRDLRLSLERRTWTPVAKSGSTIPPRPATTVAIGRGTRTRAHVCREIVENQAFVNAAFTGLRAEQYFGYLRRDPKARASCVARYLNANPNDCLTMVKRLRQLAGYRAASACRKRDGRRAELQTALRLLRPSTRGGGADRDHDPRPSFFNDERDAER